MARFPRFPRAPTGCFSRPCVRKPKASFIVRRFWAKCLKCGHKFIAYEMIGCVHSRGDKCNKCGSEKYEFVKSLTPEETAKIEADLSGFLASTLRERIRKRSCKK